MQHERPAHELVAAMTDALRAGNERLVESALAEWANPDAHRALVRALDAAHAIIDEPLRWRLFSIPLLIVVGGRAGATMACILDNPGELKQIFETGGALGPMRNFALGNTLVSDAQLDAFARVERWRRAREEDQVPLDLPPAPISLQTADEQLHLRFLNGISVTSAEAPDFTETAGNVSAWGLAFTRALAAQLGQPGLSVLPIPRPPMRPLTALMQGRFARSELGFQLFLSNALRAFRARVGEAEALVSSCADASVRIRLTSPFDDALAREYAWPLHPSDDIATVGESISTLLSECRVANVRYAAAVEPVGAAN